MLQQFGEIVNQIVDDATPSIVINFKSRKEAEVALMKGRTFQDRLLSVTWVSSHHLHRGGAATNPNTVSSLTRNDQVQSSTEEEIDLEVRKLSTILNCYSDDSVIFFRCKLTSEKYCLFQGAAEELLLDENEEEEDEDGESRSWRR